MNALVEPLLAVLLTMLQCELVNNSQQKWSRMRLGIASERLSICPCFGQVRGPVPAIRVVDNRNQIGMTHRVLPAVGKAGQVEYLDTLMLMVDSMWRNPYIFVLVIGSCFSHFWSLRAGR